MSIITISRGSYSRGKEVAEKLAQKLNYECISRDILLEASEHFNIPEIKLIRAIHDAPSVLDRFTYGKEKYIAYIRAALLKHMQKDNIVYHGLAGHFFLQGFSHVLKVRIVADLNDRAHEEMKRENISMQEARYILKKDDDERRKWGLYLYGKDTWDTGLYDLVLHTKRISINTAVDTIIHTMQQPSFQTTPESQKKLEDLSLSAQLQAVLVNEYPTIEVNVSDGNAFINVKGPISQEKNIKANVRNIIKTIPEVKNFTISIAPLITDD